MKDMHVVFVNKKTEKQFESLKQGKYQDKQLYKFITRAIHDLKKNPACGLKIPKKLWPVMYIRTHNTNNLWKYDLPGAWRLVYTIKENDVIILSVILEWFSHKAYERRFKY